MKIEKVKTFILTFLVGLSLVMTFTLWNSETNYDVNEEDRDPIPASLNGNADETKKSVIKPNMIIFHMEEGQPKGFLNKQKETQLYDQMLNWALFDFNPDYEGEDFSPNDLNQIEVIFPTAIPADFIADLFRVDKDSTVIPESTFDRMYISMDEDRTKNHIHFRNTENGITINASIQSAATVMDSLRNKYNSSNMVEYTLFENSANQRIYLPKEANMKKHIVRYQTIGITPLKNLLFVNPSALHWTRISADSETFTDGYRELNKNTYHMDFMNMTDFTNGDIKREQLINETIQWLNAHKGWTTHKDYQYVLSDLDKSTVKYRLNYNGYSIFEKDIYSAITIQWNNQTVYQYNRPLIQLNEAEYMQELGQEELIDANELISILELNKQYQSMTIFDVALGYKIEELGGQVFKLTPAWFIKGHSGWSEFKEPKEVGGVDSAVESN
ncbi:two-component system activity regulator YycH [Aquibacillus koreensis]|uniref:Two-component system activity regulator YycH n=1 Tax=Aquibacillus koreensis TaxID=279446 RepID=A0A9X4AIU7_9BACI|nr:two-component system activity regulator YycH [Aquibacillus koreensis]MCT2537864.1 two-component system activity regulator YycH [Aquibacillus koreensis]MDC3421104.1 two-component system activity regulator YycH [Aquibacillus koreensis]